MIICQRGDRCSITPRSLLQALVHGELCRVLRDVIARGHVSGAAPDIRLLGENARALWLSYLRGVPNHRIIPPSRLLCAVDRVKFVQLKHLFGVERLVH